MTAPIKLNALKNGEKSIKLLSEPIIVKEAGVNYHGHKARGL
jgi:hypothetical protein